MAGLLARGSAPAPSLPGRLADQWHVWAQAHRLQLRGQPRLGIGHTDAHPVPVFIPSAGNHQRGLYYRKRYRLQGCLSHHHATLFCILHLDWQEDRPMPDFALTLNTPPTEPVSEAGPSPRGKTTTNRL